MAHVAQDIAAAVRSFPGLDDASKVEVISDGEPSKSEGPPTVIDVMLLRLAPAAPPDDDEVYGSAAPPGWIVSVAITARCAVAGAADTDRFRRDSAFRIRETIERGGLAGADAVRLVETAYSRVEEAGEKRPLVAQTLIDLIYYSASDPLAL